MDRIPEALRERLIQAGYDSVESLPNEKNDLRWNNVMTQCAFSDPELNKVINALFPAPAVPGFLFIRLTLMFHSFFLSFFLSSFLSFLLFLFLSFLL